MRRAARTDSNQRAVVQALRKIGATVYYIKEPCDLLVGFRRRNFVLEVKNADGADRVTPAQQRFIGDWRGTVDIVYTPEEAIAAVAGAK